MATLAATAPRAIQARAWVSLPAVAACQLAAAYLTTWILDHVVEWPLLAGLGVGATLGTRALLRRWSFMATQLMAMVASGAAVYLVYALELTFTDPTGPLAWPGSLVLWLFEAAALGLSVSYAFELLDVMSRKDRPVQEPDPNYQPAVAIQVPTYNEPLEVVGDTLRSLSRLEYPRLLVQVVDNNTPDPATWRRLEQLCRELGPRFHFMHLENWPGFKAGALNEATRRLPREYEVIGIVDADYIVAADFLSRRVGYFADPAVAFVQTAQHYRDWEDDPYLRGLFYSYRYFFDVTMPARAQRNAIIFAGTMGLVRRSALAEIGGWNEECVTEDAEASLRMLGRGYRAVYGVQPRGAGMMPLTFDGLKKQRFRWALGGIQILRRHWRELVPFAGGELRLTAAQRLFYLLGSTQWFGDLLTLAFTVLLLATAADVVGGHRLPIRELIGAVVLVPPLFLATGLLRALWGLRVTTRAGWGDAIRALMIWFALSWVVALACLRGILRPRAAFLRTPKVSDDGQARLLHAVKASRAEVALGGITLLAAPAMLVAAPAFATAVLASLLIYQAFVYGCAVWASAAALGIKLTPLRRAYRRSAQTTGERPQPMGGTPTAVGVVAAIGSIVIALIGLSAASPAGPPPQAAVPQVRKPPPLNLPAAQPTPRATQTASGTR